MLNKKWIWLPALSLMLAVLFGTLLRMAFVVEIPVMDYRNALHAHSHVAMLGWLFPALFLFAYNSFYSGVPERKTRLFLWMIMATIILMAVSFFFSGYSIPSGVFAGLHGAVSIILVVSLLFKEKEGGSLSRMFLNASLFFYLLSTISVFILPALVAAGEGGSIPYYLTIQFYLHFQFNGWFIFAVFALIFRDLDRKEIAYSLKSGSYFFWFLFVSCLLTFALALSWATPLKPVFYINSLGVLIQLLSLFFLSKILYDKQKEFFANYSGFTRNLFMFSMVAFFLKVMVQFLVWVPEIATVAYTIRNLVIGFFHLVLLGVASLFAFAYAVEKEYFSVEKRISSIGLWVFTAGVILTELIIFGQGIMFWGNLGFLPGYYHVLFYSSCLFPVGLGLFLVGQIGVKTTSAS